MFSDLVSDSFDVFFFFFTTTVNMEHSQCFKHSVFTRWKVKHQSTGTCMYVCVLRIHPIITKVLTGCPYLLFWKWNWNHYKGNCHSSTLYTSVYVDMAFSFVENMVRYSSVCWLLKLTSLIMIMIIMLLISTIYWKLIYCSYIHTLIATTDWSTNIHSFL